MPHPLRQPPAAQRLAPRRPVNHRLPLAWRRLAGQRHAPAGELARDRALALVEAALLLADEPLAPRRLAGAAGLADAAEARRQVARLRDLYDRGGSSFQ